jgi:hypothetical protein
MHSSGRTPVASMLTSSFANSNAPIDWALAAAMVDPTGTAGHRFVRLLHAWASCALPAARDGLILQTRTVRRSATAWASRTHLPRPSLRAPVRPCPALPCPGADTLSAVLRQLVAARPRVRWTKFAVIVSGAGSRPAVAPTKLFRRSLIRLSCRMHARGDPSEPRLHQGVV